MNWRPILIGVFYYGRNEAGETTSRNWIMREACAAHCAQLNA